MKSVTNLIAEFCRECETGTFKCKRCGTITNRNTVGERLFHDRLCNECAKRR